MGFFGSIRSLSWMDIIVDALTNPRGIYRHIGSGSYPSLYTTYIIPVAVVFLDLVAHSLLAAQTSYFFTKVTYGWILSVVLLLLRLFVYSAFIDAVAQLSGREGNIRDLLIVMNISLVPSLFALPLVQIFTSIGFALNFFYPLIQLVLMVWSLMLLFISMTDLYDISFARAVWFALLPLLALVIIAVFILILMAALLSGFASL